MAKRSKQVNPAQYRKPPKKRPGIHSKTKTSRSKTSNNYVKAYRGQGR